MQILANAKLNLTLDIVRKRNDGYHMLESIFMPIPFCDVLEIEPTFEFTLTCSEKLLENENNLALRAARLFFERTGIKSGARIHIEKNIPIGAGLGGGSSDAAATIKALNEIYDTKLRKDKLIRMAAEIGADVPFYIMNEMALGEGIGDVLTSLPALPSATIAIVTPNVFVSTTAAYKLLDWKAGTPRSVNTKEAVAALLREDLEAFCPHVHNIFEEPIGNLYPEILEAKRKFLKHGALAASMTGSGSAVFGIFPRGARPDIDAQFFDV